MSGNTRKTASPPEQRAPSAFPIVGIGASAGGLAALEGFFATMPDDGGLAFVVIQHLAHDHKSMLGELLRKDTAMPVIQIEEGMPAQPNHIYLNPPDHNVTIRHGVFRLIDLETAPGRHLPIDIFLRSLADDQGRRAISIILSGTGSDGTLGIKRIKGAGGMTMVQDELQAQYAGMPRSAIATGMADYVLPVEQMPAALHKYIRHPYVNDTQVQASGEERIERHMRKIFALLRSHTGHDFSNYKDTTIRRRIERRMAVHRITALDEYVRYLQNTPEERQMLFKDLLIGVTNFFRDPDAFEALRTTALPPLLSGKAEGMPVRVWVPGCSSGEEAYSLAIILIEGMEALGIHRDVQVFASDLDQGAIDAARNAVYPDNIAAAVPPERLRRFFSAQDGAYIVKKQVRELVVFAEQNLIQDPPFSRLDLVSCRNLLIYLKPDLQKRLLPLFHYTLNPGGILFLGTSEGDSYEHDSRKNSGCPGRAGDGVRDSVCGRLRRFSRGRPRDHLDAVGHCVAGRPVHRLSAVRRMDCLSRSSMAAGRNLDCAADDPGLSGRGRIRVRRAPGQPRQLGTLLDGNPLD